MASKDSTTKNIRCLIIDDDRDDCDFLTEAINTCSSDAYSITAYTDSSKAIEYLQQENLTVPQYIFLDINMPGLSGSEVLLGLNKIEGLNKTIIVIYSGSSAIIKDAEVIYEYATHYLVKPTDIEVLKELLYKLFSKAELPFILHTKNTINS